MTARIFDGKNKAQEIYKRLSGEIKELTKKNKISPKLDAVLVGNDPSSELYIRIKKEVCRELGIVFEVHRLAESTKEQVLLDLIDKLNKDRMVHGILVQFPLPEQLSQKSVMEAISPRKDVDGFNPENIGKILVGNEKFVACAPKAIIKILADAEISPAGKKVVIINHSNIIGKPLMLMLLNRNATVSVCHQHTKNLEEYTQRADIVISAVGLPGLIKKEMIREEAVVIDGGIAKLNGRVCGDVDFEEVKSKACFLTPVPGGVGPMTVAVLMENIVVCYKDSLNI